MNLYFLIYKTKRTACYIGLFDSKKKVRDTIKRYRKMKGFCENKRAFKCVKSKFAEDVKLQDDMTIYAIVSYIWNAEEEEEDKVQYHYTFGKKEDCKKYLLKYKKKIGRRKKVIVQGNILNKAFWEGGYFTAYY